MKNGSAKRRAGFSIIELMLVVAMIGILSVIAIPQFKIYQLKARRTEAYTNLNAMAKAQKSYFAEWSDYVDSLPVPNATPTETKQDATAVTTAFGVVGWSPESDVFYVYDSGSNGYLGQSCCATCFTAGAWGDLDGDGTKGALMYYAGPPGTAAGDLCPATMFGGGVPLNAGGDPLLNMVVVSTTAQDF